MSAWLSWSWLGVLVLIAVGVWAWPARGQPITTASRLSGDDPPSVRPGGVTAEEPTDRPGERLGSMPSARSQVLDAAEAAGLLAVALCSGCALVEALEAVAEVSDGQVAADLRTVAAAYRWGLDPPQCWGRVDPAWEPVAVAWVAAARAGIAPSQLLVHAAERMREREEERAATAIQRASVLLVLPLGGLFLPGFIATTVVPIVMSLLARGSGI